jgi:small subunit ribosomal protein S17
MSPGATEGRQGATEESGHVEEGSTTDRNETPGVTAQGTARVEKVLQGRVVSNKMQKTIVVEIQQRKLHRLYKKYLSRTKKIKAHDEKNECGIGDTVRVVESRPLSREKRWRLLEIVEKAK